MSERQTWSQQQHYLVQLLATKGHEAEALPLLLRQHAQVHAAAMARAGLWSFEDEVLDGLSDEQVRSRVAGEANSIAWLLWHIARIEDVTMNVLLAGQPQVLEREGWLARLHISRRDVGTAMGDAEVAEVTEQLALAALREYRLAVGRSTQELIKRMQPAALYQRVDQARVQQLLASGALAEGALGLAEAWGGRKIGGLLRQPALRHSFVHLNEARRIRQKLRK